MDGMQTPPGTTECNHSYYTGNSFSVTHSAQQLQNDTPATPVQPPASIQEVDAPASSGVISSSLLSCSAFSSQVTVVPTRFGTGNDMPLAEAITQLSFLEFLQRCGVSIVPAQPSRPPVSISLRDATVQTTPPCDVSHQVSTQTSVQQDTLSCDVAVQTSFYGAHTLSLGSLRYQCRVHMFYLSHRLDLNSQSLPLSLLLIRTCSPTLTALPAIPSSRLSVPLMWEHTLYPQLSAPKGVPVPP